ncbi:MAG: phytanoyl-CoA dioxygenase family protein [Planctomycetota bacterium]|nr:phytanoyl-CoA dioxygenase family protein [Planctomycetota bacterium]
MNASPPPSPALAQLQRDGYCLIPQCGTPELIAQLRGATDRLFAAITPEHRKGYGNQGTHATLAYQEPVFTDLITWQPALDALASLGFARPRYWSGYPIAREPHTGPLYWHQDWPFWDEPEAADPLPHQLFLMWYLTDTRRENGCLRVIPGSHLRRHPLHAAISDSHDGSLRHVDDPDHPAYRHYPEQVDVPVRAGDLVVGDARVLHASHGNTTDERRTVITLWYFPRYDEASESLRAGWQRTLRTKPPADLSAEQRQRLEPLLLRYTGAAEPAKWNGATCHRTRDMCLGWP